MDPSNTPSHIFDHLSDMRKRIILVIATFLISFVVCFLYVDFIYQFLTNRSGEKLTILGPTDVLTIYMRLSAWAAVAITIPIAAFQIWGFVSPALTTRERQVTLMYIPALFLLFISGAMFAYFILFPMVYQFVLGLSNNNFQLLITASDYFSFMLAFCLPFSVLFELPLVVLFFSHLGIVNPHRLAKLRKPAYFLLSIISISVTPPDIISDILVIVPLIGLYELSIGISRIVYRKKLEREQTTQG
ncbi:twin-arginine translocase subunit TatC [Brevibacillus laterosporus]|uniref:Sec-independent protein translocase protein TatC n=1 Tax=Brevibacillus halotolerans TaxID=1507437 RepID=A0ABT4I077_9BACL|nr:MULTISPECIES: twin-arginine translocase subunit TatC [Brevibacillus]MCR8986498.1 twin-arginine translocase subunit TatC [Brevibacillus laterosporus]MCZ0832233.1 twin-arginine translocase subunit TatC [Brevibacillus halotolerans]